MAAVKDEVAAHEEAVRQCVVATLKKGIHTFQKVLEQAEGADPVLVESIFKKEYGPIVAARAPEVVLTDLRGAFRRLPAPDPTRSQWWFTSAGLKQLTELVLGQLGHDGSKQTFCLGAPTLGTDLAHCGARVSILDVDADVLEALQPIPPPSETSCYDAAKDLPAQFVNSFDVAIIDPPWYESAIYTFVDRALSALRIGGELILTFPPRLTRPGVESLRSQLINAFLAKGHTVLSIERNKVQYHVPRFEYAALSRLSAFQGLPWRGGDLIHIRKETANLLDGERLTADEYVSFSRNPSEYRVFFRQHNSLDKRVVLKPLPDYSSTVSTRAYKGPPPDLWTTEKAGLQLGDAEIVRKALDAWGRQHLTLEDTTKQLCRKKSDLPFVQDVLRRLDDSLSLWSKFAAAPPLRTDKQVQEAKQASLTAYATKPSKREHEEDTDAYRPQYQRDRDRILWSSGFRRLTNKTQLFPVQHDDDLRQRLTHSIEVSQLASTIGTSLGLDTELIEAGALAHDIGHTPFGHAGEHSLDKLLNRIAEPLGGFNHYEHGVDVLRYLEGPYYVSPMTPFMGLNLTPEVMECVIKHTFCHNGSTFGSEEVLARSKHGKLIKPGYCHLEGQAVRAADKISYLVSDIEDGIKLGVLTNQHLLSCRFFHRPPLDFSRPTDLSLLESYLRQRRWILKLLMEDVIQASSRRLVHLVDTTVESVRSSTGYAIQHSDEVLNDMSEIWEQLQAARLHTDRRVKAANLHAARLVAELTITLSIIPDLIDVRFRLEHERLHGGDYLMHYRSRVGDSIKIPRTLLTFLPIHGMVGTTVKLGEDATVKTEHVIMAKDYVAALTDSRARAMHRQVLEGYAT